MPFNKIQSAGFDLTDNYSFTGTVSGAGTILQYKITRAESQLDTSSSTQAEIDTNLRTTITPTSASNKIIIRVNLPWSDINSGGRSAVVSIYRSINGGTYTNLASAESNTAFQFYNWDEGRYQRPVEYSYIDVTHNTTQSTIYTVYGATDGGSTVRLGTSDRFSSLEVFEIA